MKAAIKRIGLVICGVAVAGILGLDATSLFLLAQAKGWRAVAGEVGGTVLAGMLIVLLALLLMRRNTLYIVDTSVGGRESLWKLFFNLHGAGKMHALLLLFSGLLLILPGLYSDLLGSLLFLSILCFVMGKAILRSFCS